MRAHLTAGVPLNRAIPYSRLTALLLFLANKTRRVAALAKGIPSQLIQFQFGWMATALLCCNSALLTKE